MFHMFFCFDLKPGIPLVEFRRDFTEFTEHMRSRGLVEGSSPIGERQSDTILDTDEERAHQYFAIMTFRDRAQADAAVDFIQSKEEPGNGIHVRAYSKVQDPIFICWQDT
ncbi:MAG: hypothetical protein AAF495_19325 [Pseudomonadota bacterium]